MTWFVFFESFRSGNETDRIQGIVNELWGSNDTFLSPLFSTGWVGDVGRNATTATQTHEGGCPEVKVEGANTQLEAQKNHLLLRPKPRKASYGRTDWFQTSDCQPCALVH